MREFREGMAIGYALDENGKPEPKQTRVPPRLLPTHYLRAATTGAGKSKALVNDALSLYADTAGPIVLIDPKGDGLTENYMRAHASRFGFEDLAENVVHFPVPDVLPGFAFFNIEPDLEAGRPRVDAVQNKAEHYEEILTLVMGELDSNTFATVMGGVSNRLDYVTQDAHLRRIFDNTEPRFDFRDVLDENTVVLFDLGNLRDEAARLMTGVILTELEDALETRKRAASSLPDDYVVNLLVDEAASVAVSEVMNDLLEKGRSFRLSVGLSLQFPEQIEEEGDRQVYLNILNDIATTLVGKISVDREIARAMAHEEMDPTEFANRIRSLPRGEWIAQLPSPQFGSFRAHSSAKPAPIRSASNRSRFRTATLRVRIHSTRGKKTRSRTHSTVFTNALPGSTVFHPTRNCRQSGRPRRCASCSEAAVGISTRYWRASSGSSRCVAELPRRTDGFPSRTSMPNSGPATTPLTSTTTRQVMGRSPTSGSDPD